MLYMFDGHNVFFDEDATYGKSWGMKEYLEYTDAPLIVAAVECNRHPDNGRLSEYSPFNFRYERFSLPPSPGPPTARGTGPPPGRKCGCTPAGRTGSSAHPWSCRR